MVVLVCWEMVDLLWKVGVIIFMFCWFVSGCIGCWFFVCWRGWCCILVCWWCILICCWMVGFLLLIFWVWLGMICLVCFFCVIFIWKLIFKFWGGWWCWCFGIRCRVLLCWMKVLRLFVWWIVFLMVWLVIVMIIGCRICVNRLRYWIVVFMIWWIMVFIRLVLLFCKLFMMRLLCCCFSFLIGLRICWVLIVIWLVIVWLRWIGGCLLWLCVLIWFIICILSVIMCGCGNIWIFGSGCVSFIRCWVWLRWLILFILFGIIIIVMIW